MRSFPSVPLRFFSAAFGFVQTNFEADWIYIAQVTLVKRCAMFSPALTWSLLGPFRAALNWISYSDLSQSNNYNNIVVGVVGVHEPERTNEQTDRHLPLIERFRQRKGALPVRRYEIATHRYVNSTTTLPLDWTKHLILIFFVVGVVGVIQSVQIRGVRATTSGSEFESAQV